MRTVSEVAPDGTIRVLIGENARQQQDLSQVTVEQEEEVVLWFKICPARAFPHLTIRRGNRR